MDLGNFTGLREQTPYRMVLDVGAFVVGINEAELRATGVEASLNTPWTWNGMTVTPTPLGATRGGATFDPQKEETQIEVNGMRVPLMGMDRVNSYTPTLSVTLLEMADFATLKYALGQATVTTTDSGFHEIVPRVEILSTDYIPNIAVLTKTTENNQAKPMIIVLRNVKVVENATFSFEDPGELAPEVTFRAATDVSNARVVPCSIYLPENEDGFGSGS